LLVSFANLGDQLRMLNVYSRFAAAANLRVDVACNAGTETAFALYEGIGTIHGFAAQGAAGLLPAFSNALTYRKQFSRAFVPQPFLTQPLALALSMSAATRITALAQRAKHCNRVTIVPLSRSTWKEAYEDFWRFVCGDGVACAPLPVLKPAYRYGSGTRDGNRAVLHFSSSAPQRTLPIAALRIIAERMVAKRFDVTVVGSKAEEMMLMETYNHLDVDVRCGVSLSSVAILLAQARLFIGIDSSIMNLADAVGTPSVIAYTTTAPSVAGPFYCRLLHVTPKHGYAPVGVVTDTNWHHHTPTERPDVNDILGAIDELLEVR